MRKPRDKFVYRHVGNGIQVWMPPIGHPEGELICYVHNYLVPALIAVLKESQGTK